MDSGTLVMTRLLLSTGVGWKSLSRCSNHVTTHQCYTSIKTWAGLYEAQWRPDHLCTPTQKFLIIMLTRCERDAAPYHPRPHPHWRFSHALQSSIPFGHKRLQIYNHIAWTVSRLNREKMMICRHFGSLR